MDFYLSDKRMRINSLIHQIHHRWKRIADQKMISLGLDKETIACWRLLSFLYYQSEGKNIFQKTLEKETGFTKSTVSNLLSVLESRGYIKRMGIDSDARLKRIVITENGRNAFLKMKEAFEFADSCFSNLISEDEQEQLIVLLNRINDNILSLEEGSKT